MIKNISKFIINTNPVLLVFIVYLLTLVVLDYPFLFIIEYFNINIGGIELLNDLSLPKLLFMSVLFIPIIETFVFQVWLIKIALLIFPNNKVMSIFTSAILFGISHFYSFFYVVYIFLVGIVLATLFFIAMRKKIHPFWLVFPVHALHNLTIVFINEPFL